MTDTDVLSPLNSMSVLVSHQNAPIFFQLNDDEANVLSNSLSNFVPIYFFYSTLLSELSSSSHFANVFYQLLLQLNRNLRSRTNRTRLRYLFSSIEHRQNQIYLQVHDRINQYDEWINRFMVNLIVFSPYSIVYFIGHQFNCMF